MSAARLDVDPWKVRAEGVDVDAMGHLESIFALANGHVGLRGVLPEGEPRALPGTYLNGFYEERPLPYAEAGYGYPEAGQTIVNVTDGQIVRLLVDDEPLDLRYGHCEHHERTLDLRSGTLRRETRWTSPTGRSIRLRAEKVVSFEQRSVAAIEWIVEPLDDEAWIVVQSELLANDELPPASDDPRAAAALRAPLEAESAECSGLRALLSHRTRSSGLGLAVGMDHRFEAPGEHEVTIDAEGDLARMTLAARVKPGEQLRLVKFLGFGWSSQRSMPALRAQVAAALSAACAMGWNGLLEGQRRYLDAFWDRADVELDGDPEIQQAVRFALFHALQAGARGEQRAIPAKGLTGPGYDGHAFWDTETFVLPLLTYTTPEAARDALQWRHSTLDTARERARQLGHVGAAFPWRTIRGEECSAYWPAGTAGTHVNADIADAVARYVGATEDREFEAAYGVELLVETARLWMSLGHHGADGAFHLPGVTGPDEYTAIRDDNTYTNLMAQRNLREAAAAAARHPEVARRLGVAQEESGAWSDAADAMAVPFDEQAGVHEQCAGFCDLEEWDFEGTDKAHYPLMLHFPYFDLYRRRVVKQADLVMALHLRGDAFTAEEKAKAFRYYEALTVRDSSLSACQQAIVAAEVGHLDLAYDLLAEAASVDLHDLKGNTSDGVHIASLAGAWMAVVAGFGGMRDHGGEVTFAPRLPDDLERLCFRVFVLGRKILVEVRDGHARYELLEGEPWTTAHHGEAFELRPGEPVERDVPAIDPGPRPQQPPGREVRRRNASR